MAEIAKTSEPAAPTPTPPVEGAPPVPPRRSPGHRGADVKDTVAEMAAKAHEISLEAGSRMAAAMKDVVNAVSEKMRERSAAEWMTVLDAGGVPCGIVKTVLESLAEASASPLTGIAPSVPGTVRTPPPRLDEHGSDIRLRGWAAFRHDGLPGQ